jgi:hypothetical protein
MKKLKCLIIVLALLGSCNSIASGDFDPNEVVRSMHEFLIRQMEVFDPVRPSDQPPLVQTYGWDPNLEFPPSEPNWLRCCNLPCAPPPHWQLRFRGDTYDQSLAAIWFTHQGWLDFLKGRDCTENLTRARRLLDALIFLEQYDPYADGRVRAAYWANNLLNPAGTEASIMAPDAGTGNIAWFGIALTRFCWVAEKTSCLDPPTIEYYLEIAKEKANWILDHCKDDKCCGGFTGGYGGWQQIPFGWKSTEHNIDVYVFGQNLYELDHDAKWAEMAKHAQDFVKCMYVPVDGQCGYYLTGTLDHGCIPNSSPIPADAQAWTALARCDDIKIDTDERAEHAMQWLLENLKDGCECGIVPLPSDGVKFSDKGRNMQCEVTASAASALAWLDAEPAQAQAFLELLDWIRRNEAPGYDGIPDGNGIVATPCPEGAYTGYGNAWYYKLLHVASSTWTGLATLVCRGDKAANPLMPLGCTKAPISVAVDIKPTSCPNPLNLKSKGMLPVAILGTEDFDVNTIDIASIRLEGVASFRSSFEDVATPVLDGNECDCNTAGPDGYADLTLKFDTEEIVGALGDVNDGDAVPLTLTGVLDEEHCGTPIIGSDCIAVIGKVPRSVKVKKSDVNEDGVIDLQDFCLIAEYWLEASAE